MRALSFDLVTSSAAHSAHPAQPARAVVCLCAGAAAGVASRASHDAAGHLPAGRGEAEEAGTPGGLVVLALPLMGVEGHCASNSQVVVTADGVIVSQGSRTANQTHNTRHEISRAACIFCTAGARSPVSDSVRPLSAPFI